MTERFAAVDIGSNSCLMLIVEKTSADGARVVLDTKRTTQISAEVSRKGAIGKDVAAALIATLEEIKGIAQQHNVTQVVAAATHAFRSADNGEKVAEKIKDACGWDVEILSGEAEARLSYLAAATALDKITDQRVVADVGGGSTEVIQGGKSDLSFVKSYSVGAIGLTQLFGLDDVVSNRDLARADGYLSEVLIGSDDPLSYFSGDLIVVGGTIATLAGAFHNLQEFDAKKVHGTILHATWLEEMLARLSSLDISRRANLIPFDRDRAGIMLAGTLIVRWLLNWSSQKRIIVSNRGLRWGLLKEKFPIFSSLDIEQ